MSGFEHRFPLGKEGLVGPIVNSIGSSHLCPDSVCLSIDCEQHCRKPRKGTEGNVGETELKLTFEVSAVL